MGISMNCPRCTLLLGLIAAAMLPSQVRLGTTTDCGAGRHSVRVDGLQLHYSRNVSQAEAERVAAWLARQKVHTQYPGEMTFDRSGDECSIELISSDSFKQSGDQIRYMQFCANGLSEAVFNGARVTFSLWSPQGQTLGTIAAAEESAFFYN